MKFNISKRTQWGLRLLGVAGVASLLSAFPARSATPFQSPAGTWDFVESGSREGLAYITFADDFTFSGYEILVLKPKSSEVVDARNGGVDATRGVTPPPPVVGGGTNIFGFEFINGPWSYDSRGRIIGFFQEVISGTCTTNEVVTTTVTTNSSGATITTSSTNEVINCSSATNGVSFLGTVVANKRFLITCKTPGGRVSYRGVPFAAVTNLSGMWYGNKVQPGQDSTEFFTLSPSDLMPNSYFATGAGPTYSYTNGIVLVSSQRKLAFMANTGGDNLTIRATIGSFNPKKLTSVTRGLEQGSGVITNAITFQIFKQPVFP
jgi:hypothetical protein